MSIRTTISINGVTFSITSDESSEEQLHKAEAEANARIKKALTDTPSFDSYQALAFAMFKLAGEFEDLKYRHKAMQDRVNQIPGIDTIGTAAPKRSYNAQKKTVAASTEVKK